MLLSSLFERFEWYYGSQRTNIWYYSKGLIYWSIECDAAITTYHLSYLTDSETLGSDS